MAIDTLKGHLVDVKVWAPLYEIESAALDQLRNITTIPTVFHHVAAMPDVHFGKGATVGSVIAMRDSISPAAVGVDIGCGMGAIKTSIKGKQLSGDLKSLRLRIEERIPVGFISHEKEQKVFSDYDASKLGLDTIQTLFSEFKNLHPKVQDMAGKAMRQVGTLGGGNHFIELCIDTEDNVWLMLHSGSRNIGKTLAEIHMEEAQKLEHNQKIIDRDLAYFLSGTAEMSAYRHDLYWAQRYAFLNRATMFEIYKDIMREFFPRITFEVPILCHHNYVAEEIHYGEKVFVTRKGAINAEKGKMGIIPGSMGTKSFIVEGLGNPESFNSASHGAGRRMSRGEAKRHFTIRDLEEQTAGVECRKDAGVLDEIPGAYKPIKKVMNNQKDLVRINAELHQVLCVKG